MVLDKETIMKRGALLLVFTLSMAACGENSSTGPVDKYDMSKIDLRPAPATLSSERHTGAFATGSALSYKAELKPLDPSPVKEIRLDTTHKIIEIAPGV